MRPTTLSFLETVKVKAGSSALVLNCGEGDVAFLMARLLGENGNVTGIDLDGENVQTAQQLAIIKKIGNTTFYQREQFQKQTKKRFGLVYGCLQPDTSLTEQICGSLQLSDIALFEVIDFSGFNSIPKNFAFERFLDLYTALIRSQWGDSPFSTTLHQLLSQSGFQGIQHQYVAPAFLQGASRQLPSLTLESIRKEVLNQKLATKDELQVLLYELKDFEQKTHSLISLPGIHQIWGYRA
ncbi:MAG: methyltransferase domain-containing protein [Lewinellaceae bacterium]|nr:methyltransferase domain-containing protein [Lewinellaceae bacterium]